MKRLKNLCEYTKTWRDNEKVDEYRSRFNEHYYKRLGDEAVLKEKQDEIKKLNGTINVLKVKENENDELKKKLVELTNNPQGKLTRKTMRRFHGSG